MLIKITALEQWRVEATDGTVGSIVDLLFEDETWALRYLIVRTGSWLSSKRVLVSPDAVHREKGEFGLVRVALTRAQIRNCPDIDTDKPVSRLSEIAFHRHYDFPPYWSGTGTGVSNMGPVTVPIPALSLDYRGEESILTEAEHSPEAEQSHLRSSREVVGYQVQATDGDAGDIDDMAVDDEDWTIRYLVVDTKRWWPGGQVLVDPSTVREIDFDERKVLLNVDKSHLQSVGKQPSEEPGETP